MSLHFGRLTGMLACAVVATGMASAQGTTVKRVGPAKALFSSGVWVGDTLYVSGMMASPMTPGDKVKGTPAVYGDTKTQTINILNKIQDFLKEQGLTMGDVVQMHVFMAGDKNKGGTLDFVGMNEGYSQFFGTPQQPNKPTRATVQVAALVAPWGLVEIEVVAVKTK
jgi:enamine deaminase RidA (YjgF/YER057c/UK114 family)